MRWFWIDRYSEFISGQRATAIKNVTLAEDHLHDHFPAAPRMPNSLVIEGLAQTGGLLVAEQSGFEFRVVLAKIASAKFHFLARPGDTLTYRVTIEESQPEGAIVSGTSHVGERLQAEVQLFFAHLGEDKAGKSLFDAGSLLAMVRTLGIYEIGRDSAGRPLQVPPALAEGAELSAGTPAITPAADGGAFA